ncbi:HD domain-containing protein [Paraclostridium bifermentans]|uniref:HD domain-containing protein n=1 Tax=Paraclostridium bifermentans TaxID=1490 RepID=UPI00359C7056
MGNKIKDCIYGEFEIDEVLVELINSNAVQRLKGIHQVGATYLIDPKLNVTRYEHSIGVMLLIRLLGGSLEEQIAGLLHDISHTAFSHVIDFALNNKNEDYHEMIYDEVISNSQIPKILKKYEYNYKDILDDETKWTILEKDAPKLCADRIDYTLRDMYRYGYTNKSEIDLFTNELYVVNGEIVVKSVDRAKWFLDLYYKEVVDFFMEPMNGYSYNKLSKAIKIAMENNELTMEDILKTDEEVMNILKNSNDNRILKLIDSLNSNVNLRINEEKYDIHIKGKVRLIDPSIYINDKVLALSEVDADIKQVNENAMNKIKKGVYIEIL